MSANDADIRVRIAGDIADINKAIQDLRRQVRDTGREAQRSTAGWDALGTRLDGIRRRVIQFAGAYVSLRSALAVGRAIFQNTIETEDAFAQLEARLRSTDNAIGLTAAQLVEMARGFSLVTTQSEASVVEAQNVLLTYTQIGQETFPRALKAALDFAQAMRIDVASAAETVGRALGTPTKAAAALARQGFTFSGQQAALIRSLEETGRVAEAQAIILEELELAYGGAAEAARNTFGGALASLRNALGDLLSGGKGSVSTVTEEINDLTELLRDPRTVEAFQTLTSAVLDLVGALVRVSSAVVNNVTLAVTDLRTIFSGDELANIERQIRGVEQRLRLLREAQSFGDTGAAIQIERLERELEELRKLEQEYRALADAKEKAAEPSPEPGREPAPVQIDPRPALRQMQAQIEAAGVLLKAELARLGAALDDEFRDNLVRFADYYRRRAELEQRAIGQQIEEQRAALRLLDAEIQLAQERGDDSEQNELRRARLVAEITALEQRRADVAVRAARDQAEAERKLSDELGRVRARLMELQGDTVGARTAELEREFRDLLRRLATEGDAEGEALVRRLIDVEVARTRLGEIEDEYERTLARLSRAERRVELQVETGLISEREGRRRIIELHRQTADEVEKLIPLMQELAVATGDPAALERLEELKLEIEELRSTTETFAKEARETIQDAGADAFSSWLDGSRKAKDAWRDFIDDIRRRIADFLADRAMERLLAILTGGGGGQGGGGGIGTFFRSLFAGVQHEGGIAGFARQWRRVPALAFAGAPRLHDGGLALRPGEVPAILQRGEEVLTRRDPRHRDNVGALPMIGEVTIVTRDAQSFRRLSPGQIGAQLATDIIRARNRNG